MKKPANSLSASVNQKQFLIEIWLDVSRKQFGSRSGPTITSGSELFDTEGSFDCFFFNFSEKRSL